jgi:hypothetical protein
LGARRRANGVATLSGGAPGLSPEDDARGAAAKAALQKISVEGDRIIVTFSLWRLTAGAVVGFFSLLFGLILAILAIRMLMTGEDVDISTN